MVYIRLKVVRKIILTAITGPHAHHLLAFEWEAEGEEQLVHHLYKHFECWLVTKTVPYAEDVPGMEIIMYQGHCWFRMQTSKPMIRPLKNAPEFFLP